MPAGNNFGGRVLQCGALEDAPDMLGETRGNSFAGRDVTQGHIRPAECGAVLVLPSDIEGLGVLFESERSSAFAGYGPEAVGSVDVFDAIDGGEFETSFAGVFEEVQMTGAESGMVGDAFGRFHVAFEIGVGDELDVAKVGESFTADRIAGEFVIEIEVETGEVVDGVAVLRAGQAANGHSAGVAGMFFRKVLEIDTDPGGGGRAFGGVRLRGRGGRHAFFFENRSNFLPLAEIAIIEGRGEQLFEINPGSSGFSMATPAKLLESRRRGG